MSEIEHIVVLMLENRSFDQMLGFLPRDGHLSGIEGLRGDEFNLLDPTNPESQRFFVKKDAPFAMPSGLDPDHELTAVNYQLTGTPYQPSPRCPARNDGFVMNFAYVAQAILGRQPSDSEIELVMSCFGMGQLPALQTLAQNFCVCDHWFSAVPGPTNPNRLFVHAATSHGIAVNEFERRLAIPTIYGHLERSGRSWRSYYFDLNDLVQFVGLRLDRDTLRQFDRFGEDVAADDLADYTFIQPRFLTGTDPSEVDNSQHAPADVRPGDELIATVYNALRGNPTVWRKTLLIVTYDEHGGFYDHVTPPFGAPNPDGRTSANPPFEFTRLGLRVPTVLVSPWIAPQVDSTPYCHTSILATVKAHFGLPRFLTARDAWASDFSRLLSTDSGFRESTPEKLVPAEVPIRRAGPVELGEIQRAMLRGLVPVAPSERAAHFARVAQVRDHAEAKQLASEAFKTYFDRVESGRTRASQSTNPQFENESHSDFRVGKQKEGANMTDFLASAIASKIARRSGSVASRGAASRGASPAASKAASAAASKQASRGASRRSRASASKAASRGASRAAASAACSASPRSFASRSASRNASRRATSSGASRGASRAASIAASTGASRGASRMASGQASSSASRGASRALSGAGVASSLASAIARKMNRMSASREAFTAALASQVASRLRSASSSRAASRVTSRAAVSSPLSPASASALASAVVSALARTGLLPASAASPRAASAASPGSDLPVENESLGKDAPAKGKK